MSFCFACHMFIHFPCIRTLFSYIWYIWIALNFSDCSSFLLPLNLFTLVVFMASKRKSTSAWNPLRFGASSSTNHSPSIVQFRDDDAFKAFSENFSRQGIHSERQALLLDFTDTDLPFVIHSEGSESLCDILVTCLFVLIQEFYFNMHGIDRSVPLFFIHVRGTCIPVTPQLVADVLHVRRIEFPDYPTCEHLRIVSRDELMSSFYERPTAWDKRLFTPCRPFAKGSRFMNMVMTLVLHLFSHYNTITEPRAWFLLSLLKHLTIDFLSHFILSIIDVHLDLASHNKLIFPFAITRILRHFSCSFSLFRPFFHHVCHRLCYR